MWVGLCSFDRMGDGTCRDYRKGQIMKASQIKQGQLFIISDILLRRVYIDGYITTMKGHSGLDCIIGTNDTMLMLIAEGNTVIPFDSLK